MQEASPIEHLVEIRDGETLDQARDRAAHDAAWVAISRKWRGWTWGTEPSPPGTMRVRLEVMLADGEPHIGDA